MSTTAIDESALIVLRARLHALGIGADDIPDELVPTVAGGSLMPALPGWTVNSARDWAAVVLRWPEAARRVVAWTEANAGRLANLEGVVAWPTDAGPGIILRMGRRDHAPGEDFGREVATAGDHVHLGGSTRVDGMRIDEALASTLARLDRIPRPWHAELAAAVAAARRGGVRPDTLVTLSCTHQSYAHGLTARTRLRVLPAGLMAGMLNRVNRGPFCGAEAGELLVAGFDTSRMTDGDRSERVRYDFAFRPGLPWSRFLNLGGSHAALSIEGNPVYDPADFFELP